MVDYIYLSDIMDNLPGLKDIGVISGSNIIFETSDHPEGGITFKGFRYTREGETWSTHRINVEIEEDLGPGEFGGIKFKDWFEQCFMAYTPDMKKTYLPVLLKTLAFVFNRRRSIGSNSVRVVAYRHYTSQEFYDFIPYSYVEAKYHIGHVPSRLNFASLYFMGYLNCHYARSPEFLVGERELNQIPGISGMRGGKKSNLMIYERWPFYVKKLLEDERIDKDMIFDEALRLLKYFMCVSEGLDTGDIPHDIFCTGLGSDYDDLEIEGPITKDTPIPDSAKYYPITQSDLVTRPDDSNRIGRYLGNAVGMCFWIIERIKSFEYLLDHIYKLSLNEGGSSTTVPIKYLAAYLMPPNGYEAQLKSKHDKIIFERWENFISNLPRLDRRKLSTSTLMQICNVLYETTEKRAADKIVSLIYQLLLSYDKESDIDKVMDACMSGALDVAGSPEAQYLRWRYYSKWKPREDIDIEFRNEFVRSAKDLYLYKDGEFVHIGGYKLDRPIFDDDRYLMRLNGDRFNTWDEVKEFADMDDEELMKNLYITEKIGPHSAMKDQLFMSSNENETLEYMGQVDDREMAIGTDETWSDDPYDWSEFKIEPIEEEDTDEG